MCAKFSIRNCSESALTCTLQVSDQRETPGGFRDQAGTVTGAMLDRLLAEVGTLKNRA